MPWSSFSWQTLGIGRSWPNVSEDVQEWGAKLTNCKPDLVSPSKLTAQVGYPSCVCGGKGSHYQQPLHVYHDLPWRKDCSQISGNPGVFVPLLMATRDVKNSILRYPRHGVVAKPPSKEAETSLSRTRRIPWNPKAWQSR